MRAVYYRDLSGYEPVKDYLARLPSAHREAIFIAIDMLNRLESTDPPLPFPLSSQIEGPLRELRCHFDKFWIGGDAFMKTMGTAEPISPIGTPVAEDIQRWVAQDATFRARWVAGAEFREIAWLLIKYRMDHGLTQEQLAERVGTSATYISRIESGRHKTSCHFVRLHVVNYGSYLAPSLPSRRLDDHALAARFDDLLE